MDGRLWMTLYHEIHQACKSLVPSRRAAGRPQVYRTEEILVIWVFAALMDWPISVTHHKLTATAVGWWLRRHWAWDGSIPSVPTLTRRAKQPEFRRLLRCVSRRLRRKLGRQPPEDVFMDSTFLTTGFFSHDPESRWTCHGGKWFRGYALHTICDEQGRLWAWRVTSANVQEMRAARHLIRQLAAQNIQEIKMVIADSGYDSEPLHQLVRRRLKAMLLAPINKRAVKKGRWQTPKPGREASASFLQKPQGQKLMSRRNSIERWYSLFKGSSNVSMLPYHVRHLRCVRRWVDLKLLVFFAHQYLVQKDLQTVA